MPVPYVKQTWVDGSGGGTPISATRLGVIEQGIEDAQFPTPGYVLFEDEFFNAETADGEIGILGWKQVNSAQGSTTYTQGVTDHIGITRISVNATIGNIYGISTDPSTGDSLIMTPQINRVIWIASPNSQSSGSFFKLGLCTDPSITSSGTDGVWWEYNQATNANWRSVSRGSSTNTSNNSAVATTAGNWYKFEIRRRTDNGNWEFYLNDTLRFTHSTNLPATGMALQPFAVCEATTAASKQMDIDYFALMSVPLGNRYT